MDQYLSFAEFQAQQRKTMAMSAWAAKLDGFLTLNDRDILGGAGRISHTMALEVAGREFEKYDKEQRRIASSATDFDKAVDRIRKFDTS